MAKRDYLPEALARRASDLAAAGLVADTERRIIETPYSGKFCFPARFSLADCLCVIDAAVRAVIADREAHVARHLEFETAV
jgi:hypothetical protein